MSDDSLFSRHLRLLEEDRASWSKEDQAEQERLASLSLPPLRLQTRESWWRRMKIQLQFGALAVAAASVALVLVLPQNPLSISETDLAAKGSISVAVIWERAGKVTSLSNETVLENGDKVGASVTSSEEAVAYWAVTDHKFNTVSEPGDVEASRLDLEPGVAKSFASSFQLIAPNQGENLVVVVCPKEKVSQGQKPTAALFDQEFVSRLIKEPRIRSSQCVFAGFRLRRLP